MQALGLVGFCLSTGTGAVAKGVSGGGKCCLSGGGRSASRSPSLSAAAQEESTKTACELPQGQRRGELGKEEILKQETREEIEDEEKREDDEKRESLDVSDIQPGRGEVASSAFEEKRLEQADVEPPSGESEEEVLTPRSVANAAFSAATGEESGVAESDIAAAADCGECLSESTPHSLAAAELAAASASGEEAGNAGKSSRSLSPRGDANAVAAEAGVVASMHRGEQMSQGCGEEHAAADSGPLSEPLLQQRAKQMLAADDEGEAETSTEETATGIVGKLRRLHIPQDDAGVYGGGDGASASQSAESTGTVDVESAGDAARDAPTVFAAASRVASTPWRLAESYCTGI
ncbi:uncharacterized protein LOC34620031 [Cyclospora cayetanensis]|uniref:Uncharacterized protein LOC34620031 n=1 Tax=Cyclospora cayetanensis TaxID=88456 RepID=A0A6P6RTL7_9EIME|nr:uncharacterized protein LOC34620031 [Cyclospora cayetanensis]